MKMNSRGLAILGAMTLVIAAAGCKKKDAAVADSAVLRGGFEGICEVKGKKSTQSRSARIEKRTVRHRKGSSATQGYIFR